MEERNTWNCCCCWCRRCCYGTHGQKKLVCWNAIWSVRLRQYSSRFKRVMTQSQPRICIITSDIGENQKKRNQISIRNLSAFIPQFYNSHFNAIHAQLLLFWGSFASEYLLSIILLLLFLFPRNSSCFLFTLLCQLHRINTQTHEHISDHLKGGHIRQKYLWIFFNSVEGKAVERYGNMLRSSCLSLATLIWE